MPCAPPSTASPKRSSAPLVVAGFRGGSPRWRARSWSPVGIKDVPSSCSIGSRQCVAPPGDPSFDRGTIAASRWPISGSASVPEERRSSSEEPSGTSSGFQSRHEVEERSARVVPWVGDRAGGVDLSARYKEKNRKGMRGGVFSGFPFPPSLPCALVRVVIRACFAGGDRSPVLLDEAVQVHAVHAALARCLADVAGHMQNRWQRREVVSARRRRPPRPSRA